MVKTENTRKGWNMGPSICILHLEDDPNDVELVRARLEEAGLTCRVTVVQTQEQYEESLRQGGYDIILADYRLPMYDGMSALRRTLEVCPDVPFVFVSGTIGEEAAIEGLKSGATDYVLKQNLIRIAPAVERARLEAENRRAHRQAQKALKESEAKMRNILENIGIGVVLISPKMEILELNRRMRDWFPRVDPSRHSICFRVLNDPPGEATCDNCPASKTFHDGQVHEAVIKRRQADGNRSHRLVTSPIRGESGEIVAVITLVENITELRQTKEDLQRSRDLLQTIVEAAPIAIIDLDTEGNVQSVWNPAAEKMLGWSAQEVMGRPLPAVPTDHREEFRRFREQVLSGMSLHGIEVRRHRRDGTPIDYSIYASPLHDAQGHITGNVAALVDITERKRAEEKKAILDRIAEIFLTTSDLAIFKKILTVVLKVMKSRYGIFGYIDENKDFIIPSLTQEIWDECRVAGKSITFPPGSWRNSTWGRSIREKKTIYSEGPFNTPDGHITIDRVLSVPIVYGNETIGLISVANSEQGYTAEDRDNLQLIADYISPILNARLERDRQERKREHAEETLRKLSRAVEQSPVSIIITDTQGNIEYVNPKFSEITGYPPAEVLGKNPRILKSGRLPSEFYQKLWNVITSGREWHGEFHNRKKSGEVYWESASISPIFDKNGAITHYVAIKEDITARKNLEAQFHHAQKMESIGRLAGGVAHDYNNMLGVIMGRTELALQQVHPSQPLYSELQEIRQAAQRSAALTRQLLIFARKQTVVPRVLDLNQVVERMHGMLQRMIGEDINLVWLPGTGLWPVEMDPSQIDQILANLCVNARDAITDVGEVTIETGTITINESYCADHPHFAPGDYVMLVVRDDGHGMRKEILDSIFEPFFTTKEVGKGTGLGLATVYGIVKQNNGFINVYSEPEHGTVFRIYLPRYSATTEQPRTGDTPTPPAHGHETVLLVEDEPALLAMVKRMLEACGYSVLASATPREAIRIANENSGEIKLLITDLVMPGMTGRILVETLIPLYPELKYLFMSGYSDDVIARQGVLEEGAHFIQKPFSIRDLAAKIREVLENG